MMADKQNRKSSSSLFGLPKLFTGFAAKISSETDYLMSPTSILDAKPFSVSTLKNSFWSDNANSPSPRTVTKETDHKKYCSKLDSKEISLGIVDVLKDEDLDPENSKPGNRMLVFGSHSKIQIPPLPSSVLSPGSSDSQVKRSVFGSQNSGFETLNSPQDFSDLELSEDYTCVISYGPNPKTTHIFDDCIIESCGGGDVGFSNSFKHDGFLADQGFLSFCHTCKKNLDQGSDIYMYRGEKAFCSCECRYQEMLLEEGSIEKLECTNDYGCGNGTTRFR